MKKGKDLAYIHNECLAKIFDDLSYVKTRAVVKNDVDLYNVILESANDFITKNEELSSRIDKSDFSITIEEIKAGVSKNELFYIEKAVKMNQNISIDNLIKEVETDNELAKDRKLAIICFITTYDASTQYWNENLMDWLELTNKPQTRASFQSVAFADAWWGFQGMLASGLNPVVGGGLAAVASAGTAIWGKAEFAPDDIFLEDSIQSVETENKSSNEESSQMPKDLRNK